MTHKKQPKGFSLLELLLVLVVIVGLLLASYSRFRRYEQEKEIGVVAQNVALVQQALDEYYAKQTNPEAQKDISVKDFPWDQISLINSALINKNKGHNGYAVAIATGIKVSSGRYIHNLIVQAYFINTTNLAWYGQKLNASSYTKNPIEWQKMPGYSVPNIGSALWPMRSQLDAFRRSQQTGS